MKKLFAIFCALFLSPMFSAQAWIGGPFSNNTYFGEQGDDGIYEAIGTGPNALGIFRIVVGNNFPGINSQGVQASGPSFEAAGAFVSTLIPRPGVASGNVVIGALGRSDNHLWYYEGVSYLGVSLGTASSILGIVAGVGNAEVFGGGDTISSSFTANIRRSGRFLPATAFFGSGTAQATNSEPFDFFVMGSKVSSRITFGL